MSEKNEKTVDKKASASVDPKLQKILDQVAELSVLELSQLVKALEKKFDVKATAATSTVVNATGEITPTDSVGAAEEKSEFEVIITDGGTNKIAVIKAVRQFKPDLGLKDAKDLIDAPPASLGTMKKDAANDAKKVLEEAGAQVDLK